MVNSAANSNCDASVDTILTLPQRTGSHAIANACREAALAFINESAFWGKAELAMWLMGPYAQVTQYVQSYSARGDGEPARPVPLLREIDARMVGRVIRTAREEILHSCVQLSSPASGASFASAFEASGFIVRCEDYRRIAGWAPSPDARRLADRVLSLFTADYLTRPSDYETSLSICEQCHSVDFDAIARVRGICHRHSSGMFVPKSRRSTAPYMPEGA